MNKIEQEISDKLVMVADRVVSGHGAVTARRAYYERGTRPSIGRFAREVADALGIPIERNGQVIVDSGDCMGSRYVWATVLIEDYRIEMVRARTPAAARALRERVSKAKSVADIVKIFPTGNPVEQAIRAILKG